MTRYRQEVIDSALQVLREMDRAPAGSERLVRKAVADECIIIAAHPRGRYDSEFRIAHHVGGVWAVVKVGPDTRSRDNGNGQEG